MTDPDHQPPLNVLVRNGRRFRLQTSDGQEYVFAPETIERAGLAEGMAVLPAHLAELMELEQRVTIHEAALRLLDHRARSEQEMRTRLSMRGFSDTLIEEEIARLREAGLVDDRQFARAWVEERSRMSPRARRMLRYELVARGIEPGAAEDATRDMDDLDAATRIATRKALSMRGKDHEEIRRRVLSLLQRRGFDWDVASDALEAALRALANHETGPEGEPAFAPDA
ncbi:MAG: hypothetical protein Kow0010_07560 [Dehalococcoidia bacterium]